MELNAKYLELQKKFYEVENNQRRNEVLKELFGNEKEMFVIAKIIKKYQDEDKFFGIRPQYILNGDLVIPYKLSNSINFNKDFTHLTASDTHIFSSVNEIVRDKKLSNKIKSIDKDAFIKCGIILNSKGLQEHHKKFFSVLPKTVDVVGNDLKSFMEQNGLQLCNFNDCSLYKLFDNKPDSDGVVNNWTYDDFLCFIKEDIIKSLEITKEINKKTDEKKSLDAEIESIREDIKKETCILNALKEKIKKKNEILKAFDIDTELKDLKEVNVEDALITNESKDYIDINTVLNIQKNLKEGFNLSYTTSVITQVYACFYTKQLLVLIGNPGSGKTSLAMSLAHSIYNGGETRLIPVQPGWMDKTDLLGFYNPVEKRYVPTEFLDTLIDVCTEACKNRSKLYFICLDEMNLSQVEYYFADFLSKLQTDSKITLYSDTIYKEMRNDFLRAAERFVVTHQGDIQDIVTYKNKEDLEEYFRLEHTKDTLLRYKYEIEVPPNVKFIGTLNQDETTKDLSPKVLDRCLVVKLQSSVQDKILDDEIARCNTNVEKMDGNGTENDEQQTEIDSKAIGWECVENDWNTMINQLKEQGLTVGNRLEKAAKQIAMVITNRETFFDIVISTMILPKVNISPYQNNLEGLKKTLKAICTKERVSSYYIYQDMISRLKNNQDMLTFWSK